MEHFDAVVVGSGFGGSVSAYRLAETGQSVCLLERGKAYPPGSFARTPRAMHANFWDPSAGMFGLFDVWSFKHIDALISSGLGGGSLIYANVLLRKDEKWFVREQPGMPGHEYWPVTRAELDPHYERVERMMNVQRYPFHKAPYDQTEKTRAMRMAGEKLGLEWMLPPLAVTFANDGAEPVPGEPIIEAERNLHDRTRSTCRLCGECDVGCNYGSKNSLDYTYLSAAKRAGADLRTLAEVKTLAPRAGGGYLISYRQHVPGEPAHADTPLTTISANRLILSAGTFGTTYLLLANRAQFPGLSRTLGSRFCSNGDLLAFALRCSKPTANGKQPWALDGTYGPVITSSLRMPDALDGGTGRGFYVEDAGYPAFMSWLVETAGFAATLGRAQRLAWRRLLSALGINSTTNLSADIANLLGPGNLSASSIPLLGMGRDVPDGNLSLEDGLLSSDWTIKRSSPFFTRLTDTMRQITETWGGDFQSNPTWHLGRRIITVHGLGGAPMGRNADEGVVNEYGEVFGYPGLHIADGSIMPGPVGTNPSLTIAALADRFADRITEPATATA